MHRLQPKFCSRPKGLRLETWNICYAEYFFHQINFLCILKTKMLLLSKMMWKLIILGKSPVSWKTGKDFYFWTKYIHALIDMSPVCGVLKFSGTGSWNRLLLVTAVTWCWALLIKFSFKNKILSIWHGLRRKNCKYRWKSIA